jgi:hypothetical protein
MEISREDCSSFPREEGMNTVVFGVLVSLDSSSNNGTTMNRKMDKKGLAEEKHEMQKRGGLRSTMDFRCAYSLVLSK